MWEKFVFICATSGLGAITRQPFDVFRSIPESRALLKSAMTEAVNVGRAKGVPLADDIVDALMKRIDGLPDGMVASMQKDIMEGKPSELEAQTGAMLRIGACFGNPNADP